MRQNRMYRFLLCSALVVAIIRCAEGAKDCHKPQEIPHGSYSPKQEKYPAYVSVTYTCDKGYKLKGSSHRQCQKGGNWNHQEPRCEELNECDKMGKICHEHAECRGHSGKFECVCRGSYRGDGYNCHQDECQKRNFQTCHKFADCKRISDKNYKCECRSGYKGDGINCQGGGCKRPNDPTHGRILSGQKTYVEGNVITYQCDHGYDLMGNKQRTCSQDGRWSGGDPRCEKKAMKEHRGEKCRRPQEIPHGNVNIQDSPIRIGTVATYTCRTPYKLNGPSQRTCQNDGKWSGSVPKCKSEGCQKPVDPSHGRILTGQTTFVIGNTITYQCNNGYKLKGDKQRTCLENGRWSNAEPQCEKRAADPPKARCQRPQEIPNGNIIVGDSTLRAGSVVTYQCRHPSKLIGTSQRTCQPNGEWSGKEPKCKVKSKKCQKPQGIANGKYMPKRKKYNSGKSVTYKCNKGFVLRGESSRTCKPSGQWSGLEPRCEKPNECEKKGRVCHKHAECRKEGDKEHQCVCHHTHVGDGYNCHVCR